MSEIRRISINPIRWGALACSRSERTIGDRKAIYEGPAFHSKTSGQLHFIYEQKRKEVCSGFIDLRTSKVESHLMGLYPDGRVTGSQGYFLFPDRGRDPIFSRIEENIIQTLELLRGEDWEGFSVDTDSFCFKFRSAEGNDFVARSLRRNAFDGLQELAEKLTALRS